MLEAPSTLYERPQLGITGTCYSLSALETFNEDNNRSGVTLPCLSFPSLCTGTASIREY